MACLSITKMVFSKRKHADTENVGVMSGCTCLTVLLACAETLSFCLSLKSGVNFGSPQTGVVLHLLFRWCCSVWGRLLDGRTCTLCIGMSCFQDDVPGWCFCLNRASAAIFHRLTGNTVCCLECFPSAAQHALEPGQLCLPKVTVRST